MQIPQPPDLVTGREWLTRLMRYDVFGREQVLQQAYLQGYVPPFLRTPVSITTLAGARTATWLVLPDYLALGTDDDYLRTPMTPRTAQVIADAWGMVLPTRRLVNVVWEQASIRVEPTPMPWDDPTRPMTGMLAFSDHDLRIRQQLALYGSPGKLVAGHKKDVVVSPHLKAGHVGIYGWHRLTGKPEQPLNLTSHVDTYCDYSHGIRLLDVKARVVEGKEDEQWLDYPDVLADTALAGLASDEGASLVWRQPGV